MTVDTKTNRHNGQKRLKDCTVPPKTMVECLDYDDPIGALQLVAVSSATKAEEKSILLLKERESYQYTLPEVLTIIHPDHPIYTVTACADSISSTLTKIASGGSQASQEIRKLETEKRELEEHSNAVEIALVLRKCSDRAAQSYQARAWQDSAEAVRPYIEWIDKSNIDPRVRMYAGEYTIQQLQLTYDNLKKTLLLNYESAVQTNDLQSLGQLTPILSIIQLENEGLKLYLQYLETTLQRTLADELKYPQFDNSQKKGQQQQQSTTTTVPPFIQMAKLYNAGVTALRHHLPMVSHCLYKAEGGAAVIQLVQVQIEDFIIPLLSKYQRERQLIKVARNATNIYASLEDLYTGRGIIESSEHDDEDDCGFSTSIGSLSDVNAAMEEVALCMQHTESYMRFIYHTCNEVNKARKIRHEQSQHLLKIEREKLELTTGQRQTVSTDDTTVTVFVPMQILPLSTPLSEVMVELGGQYASIERCLLLASMQRAFTTSNNTKDTKYYRPISILHDVTSNSNTGGIGTNPTSSIQQTQALQTSLIESCLFVTKRTLQRTFATGHTGTASAMTNFTVDCLRDILLVVLTRRAEEYGVSKLKPGEGLIMGTTISLFNNASNLIKTGTTTSSSSAAAHISTNEEIVKRQKIQVGISHACALINDLEVSMSHISQLENMLNDTINIGFPPDTHDTEQLKLCVKSLGSVSDNFRIASDSLIEQLESILKPRIRSIVTDTVGIDSNSAGSSASNAASTFMGGAASSVISSGLKTTSDRYGNYNSTNNNTIRMNYNLDEESYNIIQASDGYIGRLCCMLDEIIIPLKLYLAPRLWDNLLLLIIGTVCKRLEMYVRKCYYSSLGAIAFDSDVRDIIHYTKERLQTTYYTSNITLFKSCISLSRLVQISKLLSVDDLDDVLDLITNSKRKGNWDISVNDCKSFLCCRIEFEGSKVNELLHITE